MSTARTYRKKPAERQAMQWTGDNVDALFEFTEGNFHPLDDRDRELIGNTDCTAELYVAANSVYLAIETGEWVLRDSEGFYPCKAHVFADTYEEVTA